MVFSWKILSEHFLENIFWDTFSQKILVNNTSLQISLYLELVRLFP